jgi:hypothetical protein
MAEIHFWIGTINASGAENAPATVALLLLIGWGVKTFIKPSPDNDQPPQIILND